MAWFDSRFCYVFRVRVRVRVSYSTEIFVNCIDRSIGRGEQETSFLWFVSLGRIVART